MCICVAQQKSFSSVVVTVHLLHEVVCSDSTYGMQHGSRKKSFVHLNSQNVINLGDDTLKEFKKPDVSLPQKEEEQDKQEKELTKELADTAVKKEVLPCLMHWFSKETLQLH